MRIIRLIKWDNFDWLPQTSANSVPQERSEFREFQLRQAKKRAPVFNFIPHHRLFQKATFLPKHQRNHKKCWNFSLPTSRRLSTQPPSRFIADFEWMKFQIFISIFFGVDAKATWCSRCWTMEEFLLRKCSIHFPHWVGKQQPAADSSNLIWELDTHFSVSMSRALECWMVSNILSSPVSISILFIVLCWLWNFHGSS